MRASILKNLCLAIGLLLFASAAEATLISYESNGVALVYDNDYSPFGAVGPGLTWTADANLAATENFGITGISASGRMKWEKAQEWIAAMNAASYAGASDWILWSALNQDGSGPCHNFGTGSNGCSGSGLGHLYYAEGGLDPFDNIRDSTELTNVFRNLQNFEYWSDTEPSASEAWVFSTDTGFQLPTSKNNLGWAWAVRSGVIAAAPAPNSSALIALGLLGLGAQLRKKAK